MAERTKRPMAGAGRGPRGPRGRPDGAVRSRRLVSTLGLLALAGLLGCGTGEAGQDDGATSEGGAAAARDTPPAAGTRAPRLRRSGGELVREIPLTVGGVAVTAQVAETPEQRERGLQRRESLPENHGMLFVYPEERNLSFWMRDTPLALDIAFIDRGGTIVDIQQMEPMTDETHVSGAPAMYALEMEQGWFAEHGVEVGDRVEF